METRKRIEWIDAMRGFTMLLVVYAHVQYFGLGISIKEAFNFNHVFVLFRMPLFFFISGFILYKAAAIWDGANVWAFLKKKFVVQIIPTTFFILVFAACLQVNLKDIFFSQAKGGYWFTYMLFEYFVVYVFLQGMMRILRLQKYETGILILGGLMMYVLAIYCANKFNPDFQSLAGTYYWNYYLYFTFGCLMKKYFDKFQRLLDSKYFIPFVQLSFLAVCIYLAHYSYLNEALRLRTVMQIYPALAGIVVVVAFFRKYEASFTQERRLGRCLQYVGRRTLDVYLLHYFFLPRGLDVNKYELVGGVIAGNPILEFAVSISLSILVIGVCLIVSNVLRTSPILGHYLFGVKLPKD